jgi:hypothetical protein
MAELATGHDVRRASHDLFFLWMSIALAAIVFGGFGMSYLQPMAARTMPPLAPIVHVHVAFYFGWMMLLLVQSVLVGQGNVVLHRSLGMLGVALAAGLVIFGTLITLLFVKRNLETDPTLPGVTYISLVALLGFAGLFIAAIRNVRVSAAHKRYMIFATIIFVIGGLNRIYLLLFGIGFEGHLSYLPKYLVLDMLVAAMLIHDWRTLGKPHRATVIGSLVVVVPQLLQVPIVNSAAFTEFMRWSAGLAYY